MSAVKMRNAAIAPIIIPALAPLLRPLWADGALVDVAAAAVLEDGIVVAEGEVAEVEGAEAAAVAALELAALMALAPDCAPLMN